MIVGNTLSEIGDVLFVYSQAALAGSVELTSYSDSTIGETPTRFFIRTFRWSFDGLNWFPWIPLTNSNIQTVTGDTNQLLFFEFRYERGGSDNTGILEFNGITLQGNILIHVVNNTATLESIFDEIAFNNALTSAVCNNLIKKIYNSGILPEFIDRRGDVDDKDFISFWSAICCFLAFVSAFADEFDDILFKRKYLKEYIKQQGIFFCGNEILFSHLQYISKNLYDEIRKRGTKLTYTKYHTELNDGSFTPIDGEWLRLLCRNRYDEFLVDVIKKEHHGFCIGNSSPLYNGNYKSAQINKTEENSMDFLDLAKYSITNQPAIGLLNDGGKSCLRIFSTPSIWSGLGYDFNSPPHMIDYNDLVIIDREIDYEITFQVKRLSGQGEMIFGAHGYNYNGTFKPLGLRKITDYSVSNLFFNDSLEEVTKQTDVWYSVRGIIYSEGSPNVLGKYSKSNVIGNNLVFSYDVDMLKPFIQARGNLRILIHDWKMRPLIKGKSILRKDITNPQFLHGDGLIMSWMKNNNESNTNNQLHNIIEENLIPYENKLIPIFTSPKVDDKQLLDDYSDDVQNNLIYTHGEDVLNTNNDNIITTP